jgi:hypothetical protein
MAWRDDLGHQVEFAFVPDFIVEAANYVFVLRGHGDRPPPGFCPGMKKETALPAGMGTKKLRE